MEQRFAICVVLPGTSAADIISGIVQHDVQIVGKEDFDRSIVYSRYLKDCGFRDGIGVSLLFIFPEEDALLVRSEAELETALGRCYCAES